MLTPPSFAKHPAGGGDFQGNLAPRTAQEATREVQGIEFHNHATPQLIHPYHPHRL